MDKNGDGFISKDEFLAIFAGYGFNDSQLEEIMAQYDANGDGKIDLKEWLD